MTAPDPRCIVCKGGDPACWCCCERLPGPRDKGWGKGKPSLATAVCAHCNGSVETSGNKLVLVGVVDTVPNGKGGFVAVRVWLRAWCWAPFRKRQDDGEPMDELTPAAFVDSNAESA
jgi:hypothetical protein